MLIGTRNVGVVHQAKIAIAGANGIAAVALLGAVVVWVGEPDLPADPLIGLARADR